MLASEDATPRTILALTVICSIVMIIDSTIVAIYSSIPEDPDPIINYFLFIVFVIFFALSNFMLIRYSKLGYSLFDARSRRLLELANRLIIVNQFALTSILTFLSIQILAFGSYDLRIMLAGIYLSHVSAIGYLVLLTYQFIRWFVINRNYTIIIYVSAFSIIILNLLTSMISLSFEFSYHDPFVKLRSIKTTLGDYGSYGTKFSFLASAFTYLSLISFVSIWVPSVILLRTYSVKLGKIRYWVLVMIPLIYFLFPFFANEFGIFDNLILQYGMQFNLVYYIILSPYKQIGGLLFGIVFWVTATKIKRKNLKILIRTTGIGMIILFGSTVLHGLTYIVSPPFGLVTISFMSLASYMLLLGFFASAKELSKDEIIRRELYKIAGENFNLLRNISEAEVSGLYQKKVKGILDKIEISEYETVSPNMDEKDYKEYIKEVLFEIKQKEQDKTGH